MARANLAVVVLAAGQGTRMRSSQPKVMHRVAGRPMVGHVVAAAAALKPDRIVLVVGPRMDNVHRAAVEAAPNAKIISVAQRQRRGTGHAVLQAKQALRGFRGDVLILLGDAPLIHAEILLSLVERRRVAEAAVAVLAMRLAEPGAYGRLITGFENTIERIVEASDANGEADQDTTLCNSGVMAVDGAALFDLIARIKPNNAKREFYLTDIIALACEASRRCVWVEAPVEQLIAVNTRAELAQAEAAMQARLRANAMSNGATLVDPATVWFSWDTRLGQDVTIGPSVYFGPGVRVDDGAEILAFSHLTGARVGAGAIVGPFARLRPGADIGAEAHIGNFVEVKNSRIASSAKANHLAYIGDALVGEGANVGAGTITCNYDSVAKHKTVIGANAFIGSNATLVAPVRIGARAFVAGGSTVTRDVPADALAFGRARQDVKAGAGKVLRARLKRAKTKG